MNEFRRAVHDLAESRGWLNGDEEHDGALLNRLYLHFLLAAA